MRRILYLLLGVCLALGAGLAGTFFTSRAEVPDNIVRAGTLKVSGEPTSAVLAVDALAPGASVARSLTVVNEGDLPADVVVSAAKKAGITDLYEALQCTATVDGASLFGGPLASLRTAPLRIPARSRSQLTLAVGLPESAGNDLAGDYVKLSLYVDAEQAR